MMQQDDATPDEQRGLYQKYIVQRTDGKDQAGGPKADAEYFVLDLAHDPYALTAVFSYAMACTSTHPRLAGDLMRRYYARKNDATE